MIASDIGLIVVEVLYVEDFPGLNHAGERQFGFFANTEARALRIRWSGG